MKRSIDYQITDNEDGKTIVQLLKELGYSSSNIASIKRMPENTILNGSFVHMNHPLHTGDKLVINITENASSDKIVPINIPLNIVYEDQDIVVINKPPGMPIHPSLNHYEYSLANGLAYYYAVQDKPFVFRCSNRLDRDTSGLTVVAKHLVAASILSDQVKQRTFHREYYAVIRGTIDPVAGTIDAPIGRVNDSIITRCIDPVNGERAVTHYRLVEEGNGHSLLSLSLETGRTHQIRVHLKYIGHPLVGDFIYNPDTEFISRQALHSYRIQFTHPITGDQMDFSAPLPPDMASLISP